MLGLHWRDAFFAAVGVAAFCVFMLGVDWLGRKLDERERRKLHGFDRR